MFPKLSGWRGKEMAIQIPSPSPPPFPPPHAFRNLSSKHIYTAAAAAGFPSLPAVAPLFSRSVFFANCRTTRQRLKWKFHRGQVELIGRSCLCRRRARRTSFGPPRVSASGHSTTSINRHLASKIIKVLNVSDDLCAACKFSQNGEDRVVVGTLDLNQCISLPDEITGLKPKGIGADFARAYISNVCVAKELHRNGLGYELIAESKRVAEDWGISDLYVHVAVDNEAAKNLYIKSGFTLESDEPAWQASQDEHRQPLEVVRRITIRAPRLLQSVFAAMVIFTSISSLRAPSLFMNIFF
ncbi:hypothetical protein DH2020_010918 [Rehmannia glutinosa]|uniref:N-acetyltransferase domain-containing protein n=1 Tax=Rehmannia glutinosa TaxID=99300 RepID=A0ABR0XBX7_REHGL